MQQGNINSRNTLFGQLLTNQYKRPTTMKAEFHNAVFFIPWGRRKAGEVTYQWGPIPVGLWAASCCPHRQRVEVGAMGTTSCMATGAGPAPPELTQQPNDKERTIERKGLSSRNGISQIPFLSFTWKQQLAPIQEPMTAVSQRAVRWNMNIGSISLCGSLLSEMTTPPMLFILYNSSRKEATKQTRAKGSLLFLQEFLALRFLPQSFHIGFREGRHFSTGLCSTWHNPVMAAAHPQHAASGSATQQPTKWVHVQILLLPPSSKIHFLHATQQYLCKHHWFLRYSEQQLIWQRLDQGSTLARWQK